MPEHPGDFDNRAEADGPGRRRRARALFQELNGRIEEMAAHWGVDGGALRILCECGNPACRAQLEVPHHAYEAVRDVPGRFLLAAGHEAAADEIVSRDDGYLVAERAGVTG